MGGAVRPNRTIRPFIPIAKYYASAGSDGAIASVSGKAAYHNQPSYSWLLTQCHSKGNQYCATTMNDRFLLETLFQIVFATRHSQSVMMGCTSYNLQLDIKKNETGKVSRVLIEKGQGKNFLIGSNVSVGSGTNRDRNQTAVHQIVDRRKVVDIVENVTVDDTQYDAIHIDGTQFELQAGTTYFISTMPWDTGTCDNVLGTCGSPHSNTDGKTPYIFFNVEMAIGMYEVLGNAIYKQGQTVTKGEIYVCYDCTKLKTETDENYVKIGYDIAGGANNWTYISKLGFDKNNPCARMAEEAKATSSTGYADGQYTNASVGSYEVLVGGSLGSGGFAGLFCRYLHFALSLSYWDISARLSATGMCGVKAAA